MLDYSYEELFEKEIAYQVFDSDGFCIDIVNTEKEAKELSELYCGYYI